jgi:hypothetical protein
MSSFRILIFFHNKTAITGIIGPIVCANPFTVKQEAKASAELRGRVHTDELFASTLRGGGRSGFGIEAKTSLVVGNVY